MKKILDKNFLLETDIAQQLYHNHTKNLPIADYHCHLSPKDIAENRRFDNLTKIWLYDDHYKWRAMRALGIDEKYITGDASDFEKFKKWAYTVPYTLRNPLYHWTHMELRQYFDIDALLNENNAEDIYHSTAEKLQSKNFSTHNLLRRMNVELVCTTDDPVSNLEYHKRISTSPFEVEVRPTFRPDKAYNFENPGQYNAYLNQLEAVTNTSIDCYEDLLTTLEKRIDYFNNAGCVMADHGLEKITYIETTKDERKKWFTRVRQAKTITKQQCLGLRYHILITLGKMYNERDWIQQFHLGALRNTNQKMLEKTGPDSGFDSIGDLSQAKGLAHFLDELNKTNQLPKTILYNVNPNDSATFATMAGNFNDASTKGKMQYGPAWWYLDQQDGIEEQLNILSNMGLLSCFIGMLTDSRSFLSYSRHEYFRRILCNLFGNDVKNGKLPCDLELLQQTISDICYHNAKEYLNLKVEHNII